MSLKDLLFRDQNPTQASLTPSTPNKPAPASSPHPSSSSIASPLAAPINIGEASDLKKKLVEDFKRVIEQNNFPGIDILEFSKALFKKGSNPSAEDYRQIFDVLRAVEDTLTPQHLIQSSAGYKKIILDLAAQDISKGNARRSEVEAAKSAEKQALDKEQRTLNDEIAQQEAQIQKKRERLAKIASSLKGVDQKYQVELDDIARKLSAIEQASQQVIGSFDDIENGIRSFLN